MSEDEQLSRAIMVLFRAVKLEGLWDEKGPTSEANRLWARWEYEWTRSGWTRQQTAMFLLARDLWRGDGFLSVGAMSGRFEHLSHRARGELPRLMGSRRCSHGALARAESTGGSMSAKRTCWKHRTTPLVPRFGEWVCDECEFAREEHSAKRREHIDDDERPAVRIGEDEAC